MTLESSIEYLIPREKVEQALSGKRTLTLDIPNLQPGKKYLFAAQAICDQLEGKPSEVVQALAGKPALLLGHHFIFSYYSNH